MDWIYETIAWLEANWGVTLFGGLSLGGIATTAILLSKQWVANRLQGTKYEQLFTELQAQFMTMKSMFQTEQADKNEALAQNTILQQSQAVVMDALVRMALASKLDVEDKTAIITNIERIRTMRATDLVKEAVQTATEVKANVTTELQTNPVQTVMNIAETAVTLLDRYKDPEA